MSLNSKLLTQAKAAREVEDHTEVSTNFGPSIPEEGRCPARLVGFVELGLHPQEYQGKAKDPCTEVRVTFECFGKANMREIEVDGKTKKVGRLISFQLPKKKNEKAKFTKLMTKMAYGRDVKNMAEMLGEAFFLNIKHIESKKTKRKYASIYDGSTYNISPPKKDEVDDEGSVIGQVDLSDRIPKPTVDLQLFVGEAPTLDQWKSIEIEGTYEKKTKDEDGEEITEEVSKNFLQEMIMDALDWDGSAMQALLLDLGEDDEDEDDLEEEEIDDEDLEDLEEDEDEEEEPEPPKKKVAKKKTTTKKKVAPKKEKSKKKTDSKKEEPVDDEDLLDELGLD